MDAMKELEKLMEENKDVLIRLKNGEEKIELFPNENVRCLEAITEEEAEIVELDIY